MCSYLSIYNLRMLLHKKYTFLHLNNNCKHNSHKFAYFNRKDRSLHNFNMYFIMSETILFDKANSLFLSHIAYNIQDIFNKLNYHWDKIEKHKFYISLLKNKINNALRIGYMNLFDYQYKTHYCIFGILFLYKLNNFLHKLCKNYFINHIPYVEHMRNMKFYSNTNYTLEYMANKFDLKENILGYNLNKKKVEGLK